MNVNLRPRSFTRGIDELKVATVRRAYMPCGTTTVCSAMQCSADARAALMVLPQSFSLICNQSEQLCRALGGGILFL